MIIVRGDGSRSVKTQMMNAMQEFFPEVAETQGITQEADAQNSAAPDEPYPLKRVNTGVTSIVGPGNGERPGGFVLIIDGLALTHVSASIPTDLTGGLMFWPSVVRRSRTKAIATSSWPSPPNVKALSAAEYHRFRRH